MRKRTEAEIEELKKNIYVNNAGEKAKIIEYRNSNDIDIQFEIGVIKQHVRLTQLKNGQFELDLFFKRQKELELLQKENITKTKIDFRRYQGFRDGIERAPGNKWKAYVTINSERIYLGTTNDKEALIKLRDDYINTFYEFEEEKKEEIWKIITNFDNYSISNLGNIKNNINGYYLKGTIDKDGYKRVVLCLNGKQYNRTVHKLVAEAFLPNPNNYKMINHKDENKCNNCVDNLEWCTAFYNNTYGTRLGKTRKRIKCIETNIIYDGIRVAEKELNINHSNISAACKNPQKTAGGYHWIYYMEDN